MSAPDVLAIADAIATGYASLTPPAGTKAISRSTARLPNAIPTYPFVTVEVDDGEIVLPPTVFTINFRVRFWYAKHTGDQARDFTSMLAWLGLLIVTGAKTVSDAAVGSGQQVKSAIAGEFKFFVDTYAGVESYGWEFSVPAIIRDWPLS